MKVFKIKQKNKKKIKKYIYIYIREYSNGRVLAEELYTHRIQKLFLLHVFTKVFREDFP